MMESLVFVSTNEIFYPLIFVFTYEIIESLLGIVLTNKSIYRVFHICVDKWKPSISYKCVHQRNHWVWIMHCVNQWKHWWSLTSLCQQMKALIFSFSCSPTKSMNFYCVLCEPMKALVEVFIIVSRNEGLHSLIIVFTNKIIWVFHICVDQWKHQFSYFCVYQEGTKRRKLCWLKYISNTAQFRIC